MKLVVLLLFACQLASANGFSQNITFSGKNVPLEKVFAAIKSQSGHVFFFDAGLLRNARPVSINVSNAPVARVLKESLKDQPLDFSIENKTITIVKKAAPEPPANAAEEPPPPPPADITGTVTDSTGSPIPGVSIRIKDTNMGTVTDQYGKFKLNANPGQVLQISAIGFAPQEITVGSDLEYNITLARANAKLDEVVVVGYGTQTRRQVTGAISTVRGDQIQKQPVLTPVQGLQGLTPGIQVTASGQPGTQPRVKIRGLNTILTNENPLYVVDGVLTDDITNINNSDVVSVDVLKDGAAAIYGSRAANGVVLITTKRGKSGKINVSVDAAVGFRKMTNKVKMADARLYADYTNEARAYNSEPPLFNPDTLRYNTDWFDEISRKGLFQNYNVTMSGGSENALYLFSAGYLGDEGILKGADYSRIVLRSNNEFRPAKFLKFGNVLNVSISDRDNKSNNAFTDAYRQSPAVPVKNPDGTYGYISALSVSNPVATLELGNELAKTQRYQGNIYGELTPIQGLTFRSAWGFDKTYGDSIEYKPSYNYHIFNHPVSELFVTDHNRFYWVWDNILSYSHAFGDHAFSLMVGHTAEKDKGRRIEMRATNVPPQKNLWYINQGDPTVTYVPAGTAAFNLQRRSIFSRLTYSYQNKYNLNGVLRRDGSSAFPDNRQWGTFYSIAGSWIMTEENFMKGVSWLDYLKLRVGYAELGNDGISRLINNELSQLLSITQTNPYGFPGGLVRGITFDQIKDATASWETTKGVDAGIEFGLLDNRLTGEVSYYNKLTNAYIRVPAPPFVDADGILSPSADVRNKGVEIALGWNNTRNQDFTYRFSVNATFNTNNVDKIRGGIDLAEGGLGNGEITTYTVEGRPIGSFWVYQVEGIYQDQAEIDKSAHFVGALPGDLKYRDVNGDGSLDTRDRVFVGSYQPKFYYGISGGFTWKRLDFSFDCYGNHGNKVYNGKKAVRFGNDNIEASRASRWTPANTNTTEPRASNNIPPPSTYFVESGSFLRVNNITLGYNLPSSLISKAFMSGARVYISAQNPIIIKEFSGFSPELPGTNALNSGLELGVYPTLATYMIGININFK